ncbi:flagellar capping protein [Halobacteroides halobius DSM 5150]|uniref:Flagellar hook-associated protein 2 n=1 Tax=Halobacteroides halobius (strain ATCC 35273 / DSM 5150 / MD-1) TaxID=748449 RepID=L0KDH5_HALHC|nr:flagellar filament capping protein FliD [Halobacteroides halobius]AGB42143.1 flagellar capping protein [Halobacteroides halobius DSM 5150]
MDVSLSGLASGFPTDQFIKKMMYISRQQTIAPIQDDISQIRQEKNAWRDVNSRLSKLDKLFEDLQKQETFTSKKTTTSDKDVLTASATTEAIKGSYDITIDQKAQAQRVVGSTKIAEATSSGTQDATTADGDASDIAMEDGKTYDVTDITDTTIDGSTYKYGLTNSNGDVVAISKNGENYTALKLATAEGNLGNLNLDTDTGGNYNFGYQVSTGTTLKMHGTEGGEQNTLTQNSLYDTVGSDPQINKTIIDMTSSDTLSDFVTKINDSQAGVTASIVDNRLVLESNKTGADSSMTLNENGGNLLTDLGVYDSTNSDNGYVNEGGTDGIEDTPSNDAEDGYQPAQDAKITINGISGITSSDNSFENAVDAVTFNIENSAQVGDTATIDVSADTDKAYNALKDMVNQYNSVVDFTDTKSAKKATLQGDGTLMRLQSSLRTKLTEEVATGNDITTAFEVGIEVDRYGKISINKSEFKKAIQNNPQQVVDLFTADSEDANYNYDGIATKLKEYTNMMVKSEGIIPNKTEMLGDQIERMKESIKDQERNLALRKQNLEQQFLAMEKAIANMNSQQSWLSGQISSLGLM